MDPHYNGDALSTLWANTLKTLTLFYTDNMAVYYLHNDTVLDVVSTILFTLGLVYCLWFWRKQHNALLPIWFAAGLLPSVLSHAVRLPHALRIAPLIPLAPLLVAVAGWYLWQTLAKAGLGRIVANLLLAGALVLVAALNLNTYFVTYAHNANVYESFDPVPSHTALAINDLNQKYDVFVMPLISEHSSFRLLTYEHSRYRWLNQTNVVGVQGLLNRDIVCVLSPLDVERYQDRLSRLRRDYPKGVLTECRNPSGGTCTPPTSCAKRTSSCPWTERRRRLGTSGGKRAHPVRRAWAAKRTGGLVLPGLLRKPHVAQRSQNGAH